MILALHVKILILINALNAMLQISVKENLMGIYMVNVFVKMVIMMMAQIIYANHAIIVGKNN